MPTSTINTPTPQVQGVGFSPTIWSGVALKSYNEISAVPIITKKQIVIRGNKLVFSLVAGVNINKTTTSDPQNAQVIYQTATPTQIEINMDKVYNWGLTFNDITLFQTNLDLLEAEMIEAAQALDEEISTDVYADIYNSAGLTLGAIEVSGLNAYDYIVNLGTQLNKNKIPKRNRYVMIDYDYLGMLSMDPRFTFQPHILENGIVEGQKINGMTIIATTQLPQLKGGATGIFAIQRDGYGFGLEFDKVQHLDKLENSWNEAVRGRALCGFGVIRANNIVNAQVTYNTETEPNIVE